MIENNGKQYLDTAEVMKRLTLSRTSIDNLVKAEKLHPVTFTGNKNYFELTEVEAVQTDRQTPKPKRKNTLAALAA